MTAEDFFDKTYPTSNLPSQKDVEIFNGNDMIEFAEAYHAVKTAKPKTELLSIGSYEQQKYVKTNDWE